MTGDRRRPATRTSRTVGALAERLARWDGGTASTVTGPGGEALRVCTGTRGRTSARGGTTYGEVFVTSSPLERITPQLVRHELVHVHQWRRYGLLFALLYAAAGRDPVRNRFEQQAGLHDGRYLR